MRVTTSVKGIVVKEDKSGKPKTLFGPFACGDVKHTVAGGKKKNVLEVRDGRRNALPYPQTDRCVCLSRAAMLTRPAVAPFRS